MRPDVLIIGGGAAAMTASLYSLRAGLSVKLIERTAFGGQIADSPKVENFPTIPSISGLEWSDAFFNQITSFGADFEMDDVLSLEKKDDHFVAHGEYGDYEGSSVILATGVKHRHLGIKGEEEYLGKGVSYCAVCDGDFYSGKDVVVIGDANTALQYTMLLCAKCKSVTLVTLFDHFFGDEIYVKTLSNFQNLTILHNKNSLSFNGKEVLESVTFEDTQTKEQMTISCEGCFVAIGQIPDNERFDNLVKLDRGFIITDDTMATSTPGIFAAGDCRVKKIRQLTTACNDGAIAALSASTYLRTQSQS